MEAVIIDCLRTAIGKAPKGTLRNTRPDDLAAYVVQALLKKHPQVDPNEIDDFILGSAFPEGEAGMNMARAVVLTGRLAEHRARHDHQSLLLVGAASDRSRQRAYPRRFGGYHSRRGDRIDEHDPDDRE